MNMGYTGYRQVHNSTTVNNNQMSRIKFFNNDSMIAINYFNKIITRT